jgi:MarR family transcriptional regulator, organic hydroperoxide resistance regulator
MPTVEAENPLALDQQVCFALYSASRAITAAYRSLLAPLGLTYPQYLVMLALWERDGRSVRELGETLHLDSGTLSPLLKRMEASGLLTRRRSGDDERVVVVESTQVGKDLRERALDVPAKLFADSGIDPETLAALRRTCQALIEES